eukprot:TRINITY_DN14624_c0_g1_i1.p1 TRINITY_DN14624_c0_g1~~TRINITY_DN14624_c0_g1_i1.p1  ORF type:complete len:377 (-),score=54.60 TRINITY_DN14624_c0_g1_i1:109-1239(-)
MCIRDRSRTMLIGALLCFSGSLVRCVPSLMNEEARKKWPAIAMLHVGQILNAAAGPMVMGPVSRLSVIWFPEHQRTTGTAIAQTANGMGSCIGFLLGPFLVPNVAHASRMKALLFVELCMAAVPLACALIHFPEHPARPLSALAEQYHEGSGGTDLSFTQGLQQVRGNRSFWLVVGCAGIMFGVQSGWSPQLQDILDPVGLSDNTVGWLGFSQGLAATVCAVCMSVISDRFQRRFKFFILCAIYVCAASMWWFALMLPSPLWSSNVFPRSTTSLVIAILVQGALQGALVPLLYEFCAELTYPVNEGTSAGVLTFIWNLATLIVLAVSSKLSTDTPSTMYAIALAVCAGMVTMAEERYLRSDAEVEYHDSRRKSAFV